MKGLSKKKLKITSNKFESDETGHFKRGIFELPHLFKRNKS